VLTLAYNFNDLDDKRHSQYFYNSYHSDYAVVLGLHAKYKLTDNVLSLNTKNHISFKWTSNEKY